MSKRRRGEVNFWLENPKLGPSLHGVKRNWWRMSGRQGRRNGRIRRKDRNIIVWRRRGKGNRHGGRRGGKGRNKVDGETEDLGEEEMKVGKGKEWGGAEEVGGDGVEEARNMV